MPSAVRTQAACIKAALAHPMTRRQRHAAFVARCTAEWDQLEDITRHTLTSEQIARADQEWGA